MGGQTTPGILNLDEDVASVREAIEDTGAILLWIDPFMAAIGRKVAFGGMVFWRVGGGQIRERWGLIDMPGLMRQLQG